MSSCWVEESAMAPSTQDLNIFEDAPRSPTKPSYIRSILAGKAHKRNHSVDEAFAFLCKELEAAEATEEAS